MKIQLSLIALMMSAIGTANAAQILFVRNQSTQSTITITSKQTGQVVKIAPGQEQRDINLPGEAILEYGPLGERTKTYLNTKST